ncbi:hypothetical protein LBMAG18_02320 [Alphaproteobacteria bacterium]|nr:hypothetical protein LBMAG18_02320 [Alphaproteobacteria bacterium]
MRYKNKLHIMKLDLVPISKKCIEVVLSKKPIKNDNNKRLLAILLSPYLVFFRIFTAQNTVAKNSNQIKKVDIKIRLKPVH